MRIYKAPQFWYTTSPQEFSIFLAGSIEMGAAENWQDRLTRELEELPLEIKDRLVIVNPRRDDWDTSWVQSIHNPQFREQVIWELESMEQCTMVAMYFDPNTKSPITLLELGLMAGIRKPMIVCCPDGYWRQGNVEITSKRYSVRYTHSRDQFIGMLKSEVVQCLRP